jgi:hypothetical protein
LDLEYHFQVITEERFKRQKGCFINMKNSTAYYLAVGAMLFNYSITAALVSGCRGKINPVSDSRNVPRENALVIKLNNAPEIIKEPATNSALRYPKVMLEGAVEAAEYANEKNAQQVKSR